MQKVIEARAAELLANGTVDRVLGWKVGDFFYDITPAVFHTAEELADGFVYNDFCGANLSKYLIKEAKKEGKVLVFLKPCDTYSFNQLIKEHRINRDNVYVVGIECYGKMDIEKIKSMVPAEELNTSLQTRKAVKVITESAVAVAPKTEETKE